MSLPSASAGEGFINIAKESAATAKALPTPSKESSCFAWSLVDLCAKERGSGAKALAPITEEARNTLANETLMLVSFALSMSIVITQTKVCKKVNQSVISYYG